MKYVKNFLPIIIILLFSLFTFLPFLSSGFFVIHDDTQIQRTFEMGKALADGMFPVRWTSDLGYGFGYPIFNFYAPLFYYISGGITLLGVNALLSTKIAVVLAILLAPLSMYFLAREFWGKWAAVFSAVLYTYVPFHAVDIFVRGDFTELLAYGLLPLPFLGIYKLYEEKPERVLWLWTALASLSFAGIVLSHNLTAFMIAPFLILESIILGILLYKRRRKNILFLFYSILLGLLISAFYWIPALAELRYTNVLSIIGGGSDFRVHFVCLSQFWYSPWGFAGSAKGCVDGISLEIGKLHLVVGLLAILALFFIRRNKKQFYAVLFSLLIFGLTMFLMTSYSKTLWEVLKPMEFFQFPWRFLIVSSLTTSFIAGFLIWVVEKKTGKAEFSIFLSIILSLTAVFYYQGNFNPQILSLDPSENYTNEKSIKWVASKISDEYMPPHFPTPENENEIASGRISYEPPVTINYLKNKTQHTDVQISSPIDTTIVVNIANFPAWKLYLNGEELMLSEKRGRYVVDLPKGSHKLAAAFKQTPVEQTANILSICGIALLVTGIITTRRQK